VIFPWRGSKGGKGGADFVASHQEREKETKKGGRCTKGEWEDHIFHCTARKKSAGQHNTPLGGREERGKGQKGGKGRTKFSSPSVKTKEVTFFVVYRKREKDSWREEKKKGVSVVEPYFLVGNGEGYFL